MGREPYREGRCEMEDDLARLRQEYDALEEKVSIFETTFKDMHGIIRKDADMVSSLQQLVENQRRRIQEKDDLIRQMQEEQKRIERDYRDRIAAYCDQIAALQRRSAKKPAPRKKTKTEEKR